MPEGIADNTDQWSARSVVRLMEHASERRTDLQGIEVVPRGLNAADELWLASDSCTQAAHGRICGQVGHRLIGLPKPLEDEVRHRRPHPPPRIGRRYAVII